jgi:hypothetical protein
LLDAGHGQLAALTGGYHVAFLVGAAFALLAAVLGGLLLRPTMEMHAHAAEEAVGTPAVAEAE